MASPTQTEHVWVPAQLAQEGDEAPSLVFQEGAFRLYVGSKVHAGCIAEGQEREIIWQNFERLGLTHVICCSIADSDMKYRKQDWTPFADRGVTYSLINTDDWASPARLKDEDPSGQWPAALAVLREAKREGGAALVHCAAGVNRSVTTAALFLVTEGHAATLDEAVAMIKAKRPQAGPISAYLGFAEGFLARRARWMEQRRHRAAAATGSVAGGKEAAPVTPGDAEAEGATTPAEVGSACGSGSSDCSCAATVTATEASTEPGTAS